LNYNRFGDPGVQSLAQALPLCSSLKTLSLTSNGFGTVGADALAAVLPRSSLTCLDLRRNTLDPTNLLLAVPQSRLTEFRLTWTEMTINETVLSALTRCVANSSSLVRLDFTNSFLGISGIVALASGLVSDNCRLKELVASRFFDSEEEAKAGIKLLAQALPAAPSLTTLVLQDNLIDDEGLKELAEVLPRCLPLTLLDLRENGFVDKKVYETLMAALRKRNEHSPNLLCHL
jgi:Ran GTPase-activating protein (RanGAP) involved in mRNA processing and transport